MCGGPLKEVATITAGQSAPKPELFSNEGLPFVRAGCLEELIAGKKESDLEMISNDVARELRMNLYPEGSILFAKSGMSATKNRFYQLKTPAYVVSHLAVLIPKDRFFSDYLRHVLIQYPPSSLIKDIAYPAISLGDIQDFKVPIPETYDDQIRIATLLSKVENLISCRREQLKQLDELLKSIFLEMFGLHNGDVKKWIIEPLSACTEIVSGVTKGKKYNGNKLRDVPYMRVANVKDGYLNLSEIKTIEVTEAEIYKYKLISGDLLLTEGGDPDKLGRGAVWNCEIEECIHQNHIFRVRAIGNSVNPVFLSALMASKYGKSYFFKAAKQTTGIASINSTQLKAFPLIKPPVDLQNQFAAIVEKVESVRSQYTKSLKNLKSLYGTLSQKALTGELDLLRVQICEECEMANRTASRISASQELTP